MTARTSVLLALVIAASSCASSEARDGFGSEDGGAQSSGGNGGSFIDGAPPSEVVEEVPCSAEAKDKVFVVSAKHVGGGDYENTLYSFSPVELKFQKIGIINCSTVDPLAAGKAVYSMSVDRSGTAWVNVWDETFKVDTKTAACSVNGTRLRSSKFSRINMGFSGEGNNRERLYVTSQLNGGDFFGRINTTGVPKTEELGRLVGDTGGFTEFTGTSDGLLFGFVKPAEIAPGQPNTTTPMWLASINKANAQLTKIVDIGGTLLNSETAYGFSFWGGDFWFYFSPKANENSKVIRYKASGDKSQSVVMTPEEVGFRITGAGVSTCAPLTFPGPK